MKAASQLSGALASRISARALAGGAFEEIRGGEARADATALAALALAPFWEHRRAVAAARDHLAAVQREDGIVPVLPGHAEAFWTTSLALLAWSGSAGHGGPRSRAAAFLLGARGRHWEKGDDSPFGHDTALRGWSWTRGAHSWVEPTSLALLALRAQGEGGHRRVAEGEALLLDRQLPRGGWNYGNTTVFGQTLRPMIIPTGLALLALANRVDAAEVSKSVDLLRRELPGVRSPLSLGWSLLGLDAWGAATEGREEMAREGLELMERHGLVATTGLALLLLSLHSSPGSAPLTSGPKGALAPAGGGGPA